MPFRPHFRRLHVPFTRVISISILYILGIFCYNKGMNTSVAARKKSIASALGSLHAEGMVPNKATQAALKQYADGKISAATLKSQAVKISHNLAK